MDLRPHMKRSLGAKNSRKGGKNNLSRIRWSQEKRSKNTKGSQNSSLKKQQRKKSGNEKRSQKKCGHKRRMS